MKIFLSSINTYVLDEMIRRRKEIKWNLLSYYEIQNKIKLFTRTLELSELMLVDSGAHSFQKGKKVNWEEYTERYADFIRKYDSPKIIGFFEMDVDNIIGYANVIKLRKILTAASDKIIPVWHKNRGIDNFKRMCEEYAGRVVAITGFRNEDIRDEQYPMFLKEAKKHNCKVHCLGMTRREILERVPFDYTDSATWILQSTYGRTKHGSKTYRLKRAMSVEDEYAKVWAHDYIEGMRMQQYFYDRWRYYHKD